MGVRVLIGLLDSMPLMNSALTVILVGYGSGEKVMFRIGGDGLGKRGSYFNCVDCADREVAT